MKKNIYSVDRLVRVLAAILLVYLYLSGRVQGTAGLLIIIFAALLVLTALIRICPLYSLFGKRSAKSPKSE